MRILVVEDERLLAEAVQRGLQAEGFDVDLCFDGAEGLVAAQHGYDAVILDIMLPGLNGYRVCRALRAAGNWTPILMLTAKDGEYDEAEALDTGADDFLSKPFSFVVLVARLRALLRRGGQGRSAELDAGDLHLDLAARTCRREGVVVHLTARETALLEYLMRHAGQVRSKADILAEVWDLDDQGTANLVEVYVGYLRRKIDQPFGRASIRTIRGQGYQLVTGDA